MKKTATLVAVAVMLLHSIGSGGPAIAIGGYRIQLTEEWKLLEAEARKQTQFDAVRIDPASRRPHAALIATVLTKPVAAEADEMAASPQHSAPDLVVLLEDRKLALKDGGEARVVSLEVATANEALGIEAPMIFHSVYLPNHKGCAVSLKLLCSKADLAVLKPAFEEQVFSGLLDAVDVAVPDAEQIERDEQARETAVAWFDALTEGDARSALALSALPFNVDNDFKAENLDRLSGVYQQIIRKVADKKLKVGEVAIVSSEPGKVVLDITIKNDDEVIRIFVNAGDTFRVSGFKD